MGILLNGTPPVVERVRAYFAQVDRESGNSTVFDPAKSGRFDVNTPPPGWFDLGWVRGFKRASGTKVVALRSGAPAMASGQARQEVESTLALQFETWGKLQLMLSAGSQHMNVLAPIEFGYQSGSGGTAADAVVLLDGSTESILQVGASAAAGFSVGDMVAVDVDYTGQLGFVGSNTAGAYVQSADAVMSDANYVRRITANVGRIAGIEGGALTLGHMLIAGHPTSDMKVTKVLGFVDREGGSFFPEWSALFVADGSQGDRVIVHYPRLQPMRAVEEVTTTLQGAWESLNLSAAFRALPVTDPNDGERVLCYRTYLPAAMREV